MDPEDDMLMDDPGAVPEQGQMVPREPPEPAEARKNLVEHWTSEVQADKKHWEAAFKRMKEDQDFAFGRQWSKQEDDNRYTANIVLRHIQQRVAALYAKNPKTVARMKNRLLSSVWDGSPAAIMRAYQQLAVMSQNPAMLMSPEGAKNMALLQEAQQVTEQRDQIKRFAQTLEMFYQHQIDEQTHPFKTMMKLVVRRAVTTGVGYVKIGFHRAMGPDPDAAARLSDAQAQFDQVERMSQDVADGELSDEASPELERLRLLIQNLENSPEIIIREGLTFDYPDSDAIIPSRHCRQLREFLGCGYVTQEYILTPEKVQEIYGKDVKKSATQYAVNEKGEFAKTDTSYSFGDEKDTNACYCLVWEIWSRQDNMVYVVCDGYEDFLREPAAPEIWTERFWPWFSLILNEVDHPTEIYPPSDVRLLRHMQLEYNRLREGLREHRKQNRPTTVYADGILSEDDLEALKDRPSAALVAIKGLQPNQKVDDVLQPLRFSGVDPNLYEVGPVFEDVLRTVGVQEANLGGTGGDTATESSIAESSRMSSLQSNIDELDDMLSHMARTAGQILLDNVTEQTVKEVVGPAAIWPTMSRDQLAREVFLEIEAGSTGRPNQAQEIQNFERLAPILMGIPGIRPAQLAQEAIRRLDDKLRMEDFLDENLPSINTLNQMAGAPPGGPQQNGGPNAPAQQGAEGQNNAQRPQRPAGNPGGPDVNRPPGTAGVGGSSPAVAQRRPLQRPT